MSEISSNTLHQLIVTEQLGADLEPVGPELDLAAATHQALEKALNPADLQDSLWFLDSAPEYSRYLVGQDVAASPEQYDDAVIAASLEETAGVSSSAERAALSEIGAEGWRTSATVGCIPVLANTAIRSGHPVGVRWFRSFVQQPGDSVPTRTAGDFAEKATELSAPGQLKNEQFIHWGRKMQEALVDNHGYLALNGIGLLHDVAKSKAFVAKAAQAGIAVGGKDHDAILHSVIADETARNELLPTLAFIKQVSPRAHDLILKVFSINVEAGQLLQGEAPASMIEELVGLEPQIRKLYFQYKKLDVAGVRGQVQHGGSTIIDAEVNQDFEDLEAVIESSEFHNATERYNAYLTRRAGRLGLDIEALPLHERPTAFAQIRLATQQRIHDKKAFDELVADFNAESPVVRAILTEQLNRTGLTDTAILQGYGPAALLALKRHPELSKSYLSIYAILLQEAAIVENDRLRQAAHVGTADLYGLVRAVNHNSLQAGSSFRFRVETGEDTKAMLMPYTIETEHLENLDHLPEFSSEVLRNKRALIIGMAGSNDIVHGKALSEALALKCDMETVALLSIRKPERAVRGETAITVAGTKLIGPDTRPRGEWRTFPEGKLVQEGNCPEVHLLSSTNMDMVHRSIVALAALSGAEVVIGVDPSGDSLVPASSLNELPRHLAARQDHTVVHSLARLSLPAFTAIIGPVYGEKTLTTANAERLELAAAEQAAFLGTYDRNGLLSGEDDDHSTTAMLYGLAKAGEYGLRALPIPSYRANSETNPYRVFHEVRPANAQIAILNAAAHDKAVNR